MRRAFAAVLAVLTLGALVVSTASAHALLESADPAPNSLNAAAPATVTLTFTETPDAKLSSIKVLDSSGGPMTSGPVAAVTGASDKLQIAVRTLPDGVYTVAWRTVSALDGHTAAGSYAFSVGTIAVAPAASSSATVSGAADSGSGASPGVVIGRWLLYLGLLGLLGAAFLGSALMPGEVRVSLRLAAVELVVAIGGTILLVFSQISDAGASLMDIPGTSLGRDAILRVTPLALASGLLWAASWAPQRVRRALLAATGVLVALALLVEAILSHAASQSPAAVEITVQWLHVAAVGLWLGGLVALLMQVRGPAAPAKRDLARRFAMLAGFGLAIVALTGIIRAVVDIGSVDALVSSYFGRLVLLKVGLLVPIAALGALNHFRNVPQAEADLRPLRRSGSAELTLGAVVLLVASVLVNVAPPTEVAAAAQGPVQASTVAAAPTLPPLQVSASDFATTVRLELNMSPGIVGTNDFEVRVTDYDTRVPVDATAIRLTFSPTARPEIGSSTLTLQRRAPGVFVGTGANLSLGGVWRVSALVTEPTTSVQVDLIVSVQSVRQQIDVNAVAGLPTIYTVHLGGGRTVQVYLDPGSPGSNLLHATWFDSGGKEMPVSDVTMAQVSPAGASTVLQPQILDSGHEAAPVEVTSLPATFVIGATGPGGAPLQTQLQISQSS